MINRGVNECIKENKCSNTFSSRKCPNDRGRAEEMLNLWIKNVHIIHWVTELLRLFTRHLRWLIDGLLDHFNAIHFFSNDLSDKVMPLNAHKCGGHGSGCKSCGIECMCMSSKRIFRFELIKKYCKYSCQIVFFIVHSFYFFLFFFCKHISDKKKHSAHSRHRLRQFAWENLHNKLCTV